VQALICVLPLIFARLRAADSADSKKVVFPGWVFEVEEKNADC